MIWINWIYYGIFKIKILSLSHLNFKAIRCGNVLKKNKNEIEQDVKFYKFQKGLLTFCRLTKFMYCLKIFEMETIFCYYILLLKSVNEIRNNTKICLKNKHPARTNLYPTCEKDKTIRRLNKTPWSRSGSGLSTGASQWNTGPKVNTRLSSGASQWNTGPRVNTGLSTGASQWNTGPRLNTGISTWAS